MTEDEDYDPSESSVYVNLLENPERHTGVSKLCVDDVCSLCLLGYAGPSAQRVWRSIQQENCFGDTDDMCLEKRIFYRLMSGLQSSISTHIAREYFHPTETWGPNIPLFVHAVGSHSERLANLYFAFLFVTRAVVKAGDVLVEYDYKTDSSVDGDIVRSLINELVLLPPPTNKVHGNMSMRSHGDHVYQCRTGFDESVLFQLSAADPMDSFYSGVESKLQLMEQFRSK